MSDHINNAYQLTSKETSLIKKAKYMTKNQTH